MIIIIIIFKKSVLKLLYDQTYSSHLSFCLPLLASNESLLHVILSNGRIHVRLL